MDNTKESTLAGTQWDGPNPDWAAEDRRDEYDPVEGHIVAFYSADIKDGPAVAEIERLDYLNRPDRPDDTNNYMINAVLFGHEDLLIEGEAGVTAADAARALARALMEAADRLEEIQRVDAGEDLSPQLGLSSFFRRRKADPSALRAAWDRMVASDMGADA